MLGYRRGNGAVSKYGRGIGASPRSRVSCSGTTMVPMSKLKEYLLKYSSGSGCSIELFVKKQKIERVKLEFSGPIAHIPSLKNSKMPGKNFTNVETMARLKVMDYVYKQSVAKSGIHFPVNFGKDDVALILICAKRKVAFDTDNCLATIRDWLEPPTKKVGKGRTRGWGVGLVDNDRQIKGIAIYDRDIGLTLDKSIVVIQRYDRTKDRMTDFVHDVFFDISEDVERWVVN